MYVSHLFFVAGLSFKTVFTCRKGPLRLYFWILGDSCLLFSYSEDILAGDSVFRQPFLPLELRLHSRIIARVDSWLPQQRPLCPPDPGHCSSMELPGFSSLGHPSVRPHLPAPITWRPLLLIRRWRWWTTSSRESLPTSVACAGLRVTSPAPSPHYTRPGADPPSSPLPTVHMQGTLLAPLSLFPGLFPLDPEFIEPSLPALSLNKLPFLSPPLFFLLNFPT